MEDGREGFVVGVGDAGATAAAVALLLDDGQLPAEMGVLGRETYKRRFTVERLCGEVRLIYDEATGSGIGPHSVSVEAASILSAPVREVEPPVRKE